ncbi:DNA (cytosine-5)-methyltransferase 1A-like [Panicum miliaceum]|uniref:DNA (Cytosine-5)-methyltransferase 1A-like n=1 Tax=Panicum miliaceum TaxID=4540 RepID=A0A3L6TKY3_PANMI|nr:DNA (cytosine-5)-methyltransferase 1A-like [Panicum miliaceum]
MSLRSKSEDVKMTENKSDDPVDETPTSQSKTKRQFTRRGNLEKRTGSKKLLILKGKQENIKPKLPNKKRKLRTLWFYLVAAFDQKGQPPLPQVASKFLRIKDVDLPASFIQKYLVQKLNLSSEAEVDILCGGKPVSPGMSLHDLADCWLNKGQKGRVRSSVGTPAAGFIAKHYNASERVLGAGVPFRCVGGCVVSPIVLGNVAGRSFSGTGLHFTAPSSSLGLRSELSFAVSMDGLLGFLLSPPCDSAFRGGIKKRKAKLQNREVDFTENEEMVTDHEAKTESNGTTDEPVVCKRPKRAAAASNFKEKELDLSEKYLFITFKESRVAEEEIDAVMLTKTEAEDRRSSRKLIDFTLHDADGNVQPFEMSEVDAIFITALVMPLDDGLEKDREKGIRCSGFGRIKDWTISGYNEGIAAIWVSTEIADYKCVKPASSYRSYFEHFSEKARVCVKVYKKLVKSVGGNPQIGLEELLASVVRSINSNRKSGGTMSKDFVISIDEFIYSQLVVLDNTPAINDEIFATFPVLVALRNESKSRVEFNKFSAMPSSGTLKIKDELCKVAGEDDEKLARLLQEEEEWKLMKQRGKRGTSQKNVYIKISETKIANDYPLAAYYKSYSQEMDEYIFDCDIGMFSEDMQVRILNNWALYNSDSRLIPLELIPMKSGAENDTVIYGSGFMSEDDGSCCSTAESAQLSSCSSTNYASQPSNMLHGPVRTPPSTRSRKSPSKTCKEVDWKGQTAGKTLSGEDIYKCATVRGLTISAGQLVTLEDDSGEVIMYFTEYMYEKHDGTKMVHGRILQKGFQTVLGNAANEREVFLTNDCLEFEVGDIKELVTVNVQLMPWGYKYRKENSEVNRIERVKAEERKRKGLAVEYFCKSLYWPEKGAFFSVPHDKLGIGTGACSSCEGRKQVGDEFKILSETSFVFKNIRYNMRLPLFVFRADIAAPPFLEGVATCRGDAGERERESSGRSTVDPRRACDPAKGNVAWFESPVAPQHAKHDRGSQTSEKEEGACL